MVAVMFAAALLAAAISAGVSGLGPASAQTGKLLAACDKARKVIDATKLPAQFDSDICKVGKRIIKDRGGVSAALPQRGTAVYVEAMKTTGAQELTIKHLPNGTVKIEDAGAEGLAAKTSSGEVTALGGYNACSDRRHSLMYTRVYRGMRFHFNKRTTPRGVTRRAAEVAVRRAQHTLSKSRNTCRMGDQVPVHIKYAGNTRAAPKINRRGGCMKMTTDKYNVVAFGRLPATTVGQACIWRAYTNGRFEKVTGFDIKLNKYRKGWTSRPRARMCRNRDVFDVQSVATHEFGHVYGLGHASYSYSKPEGKLTMNAYMPMCDASYRTLGRGDVIGLRKIY